MVDVTACHLLKRAQLYVTCRGIDGIWKSDKNTTNKQQVRFFKFYVDFNVFWAKNRRLFSIEFQLHTNSHIGVLIPVFHPGYEKNLIRAEVSDRSQKVVFRFLT